MTAREDGHQWATNRRVRASLLVSGLRWRARSSLAMFAVAVFATGAAAFGPLYLHSADQLVLNGALARAAPGNAGLTIRAEEGQRSRAWLTRFAGTAPRSSGAAWWGTPIMTESAGFRTVPSVPARPGAASSTLPTAPATTTATAAPTRTRERIRTVKIPKVPYRGTRPFVGALVARTDVCAHLDIVAGTCPVGRGVVLSTRDAQTLGSTVGGTINVVFSKTGREVTMPIVGIYLPGPPFAAYWWEQDYFGFGSVALGGTGFTNIDAVFSTPAGIHFWAPPKRVYVMAQVPFRKHSLSLDSVGTLESDLRTFETTALRGYGIRVSTLLLGVLDQAATTEHAAATVVDIAGLELVLLGILVLYFVASRTAAEREPDVRLAELRGFGSRSTVAVALAEPVAIVGTAVPIGLLGAWLLAVVIAPSVFGAGIGVTVTSLSVVAAIVAGIVGVAAAGLGARRSLAGRLSASVDSSPSTATRSRWAVLVDVGVVAVAVAAFFELVVAGDSGAGPSGSDPLAAFAPGLLAVALGVLMTRALPWVLRAAHRRTAFSGNVAAALATRTVARRREYRTQLVLAALAVALATFAVCGWVVAARNRDQRAELGVGAVRVLHVTVREGTTFLRAVRASDPSGRHAMAVVVERASDGTTLALDASRLAHVATWPSDLGVPATTVARRLAPHHLAPTVWVRGSAVEATVDATTTATPPAHLALDVYDVDTQFASHITLGPIVPGEHRYTAELYADCPNGCRLLDLSATWTPAASAARSVGQGPSVTLDVTSLEYRARTGWVPMRAGLTDARRWSDLTGGVRLGAGGEGLVASFRLGRFGTPATFGPADVPTALPVVVTPESESTASGDGGPLVVGLDGSTLPGHTTDVVPTLPGVGADAVMTDLGTVERYLFTTFANASTEVWLSPTAPASVIASLRAHGIRVLSVSTEAAAVSALDHSGLTLAYLLYLVAAIAAGLLVVGATAFTLSSAARRRQAELAALRAVGVDDRALRRAVRAEQAIVLGAGILTGLVAGTIAAAVALRSVPEFVVKTPGPPLQLGLPVVELAVAIGAIVVALAVTVLVGSATVVRGATVDRLAGGA